MHNPKLPAGTPPLYILVTIRHAHPRDAAWAIASTAHASGHCWSICRMRDGSYVVSAGGNPARRIHILPLEPHHG